MAEHETFTKVELHSELLKDEIIFTEKATVADFQANAATGDFYQFPEKLNDNIITANFTRANAVGQYDEVDFGKAVVIKRWRQHGHTDNDTDGSWKIQYYNLVAESWEDWVTGIACRSLDSWSEFVTETLKLTTKIRLVCTVLNTRGYNGIVELEVIY